MVLTSKVQGESRGNSRGAETQDSKHWHRYVRGESRTWNQAVQIVLSCGDFKKKEEKKAAKLRDRGEGKGWGTVKLVLVKCK